MSVTAKEILERSLADIKAGNWLTGYMGNIGDDCGCAVGLVFKNAGLDNVALEDSSSYYEQGHERPAYGFEYFQQAPESLKALRALIQADLDLAENSTGPIFEKNDGFKNDDDYEERSIEEAAVDAADWFQQAIENL